MDNIQTLSASQFLDIEERSRYRHEYVNGDVSLVPGTSVAHDRIVMNMILYLGPLTRSAGSHIFTSAMKLRVDSFNAFYYPDLMFARTIENHNSLAITQPCLLIEVLIDLTKHVDLREKCMAYKSIESLKEYLIISQSTKSVELHQKDISNNWNRFEFNDHDVIELRSLASEPIHLPLREIYANLRFP